MGKNVSASAPEAPAASSGARAPAVQETGGASAPATPTGVEFVSPPSHDVYEDSDNDINVPLCFRRLDDVFAEYASVGEAELLVAVGEEAKHDQHWVKAMREEMASIEQNNTWWLVSRPLGHKPIGFKWVFKLKRNEEGAIVKHKARLVAKGQPRVDFDEGFALVDRMELVRMMLAFAAQMG
jgi:hypothetical protein